MKLPALFVKNIINSSCLLALIAASGCCSVNGYTANRINDARDILTLTAGFGLGANARCGCLHAGLIAYKSFAGLRGGSLFYNEELFSHLTVDGTVIAAQAFQLEEDLYCDEDRHKTFVALSGIGRAKENPAPSLFPFWMRPVGYPYDEPDKSFYTQIEISIGLGVGLQAGFNPGELLDFLLGWFTVDIYDDDIGDVKRKFQRTPGLAFNSD